MTIPEAVQSVTERLKETLRNPIVTITLMQYSPRQQITGEHLVGPDGYVTLGIYGRAYVVGMNLDEAKRTLEAHLGQYLESPEVSVDIFSYNSKYFYIILQGGGHGDGVTRVPITGNETVMDAVSQIQGLQSFSSKKIWVARPAPPENGCAQILPVDWNGITQRADTKTNYQLMPGDRLFVEEDKWVAANSVVSKMIAPFERAFGFILLGTSMAQRIAFFDQNTFF
jgi:polysaccharide export outer membrane protein